MKNEMKLTGVIVAVVMAAAPALARAQDERSFTQLDTTVRLDRGAAVDLSLISGKINVVGGDQPNVRTSCSIERGLLRLIGNSSRVTLSVDDSDGGGRRRHAGLLGEALSDAILPRSACL